MTAPETLPAAEAIRELPKHLHRENWLDLPSAIGTAMGGREIFWECDFNTIHRIGLSNGLGWRLPKHPQRADGIDYTKVLRVGDELHMVFLHVGERPPEEAEEVKRCVSLNLSDLRSTYEREMHG